MKFLCRIFSLLLLAAPLAAQDAPEPPEPPKVEQPSTPETQGESVKEADAAAESKPAELEEPTWDPVAESEKAEQQAKPRDRRVRTRNQPVWGNAGRDRVTFGQHVVIRTN